ncbi:MAG: hypothetical protein HUJ56_10415, partial [Erysipelotrichaceae bacterium]|nr:hypothetical protein [Erysipelotrichaceae bacterium]
NLDSEGVEYTYYEPVGAHNWETWRDQLTVFAKDFLWENTEAGVKVNENTVTFTFVDDDPNIESVTVAGNFQWYKLDDPAVVNYSSTLDYSQAVSYDAYEYEEGMFNTGYGLNGDTKVYELNEVIDGVYTLSLTVPGNLYYYDYTITYTDGTTKTIQDPANPSPANPANGHDAGHSLVYVGSEDNTTVGQEKIYARTDGKVGTYEFVPYTATDGTTQYLEVYLPYGYDATKTYPTIYVSHGGGGQEAEWMSIGAVPNIMDNLIAEGATKAAVVVTMDNTYWGWNYPTINKNLIENIIPAVEDYASVSTLPADRAFCGLSMGGLTTTNVWKGLPAEFGYLGIWSATEGNLDVTSINNGTYPTLMVSCGIVDFAAKDFFGNPSAAGLIANLTEAGYPFTLKTSNGAHDWGVWRDLFTIFADEIVWSEDKGPSTLAPGATVEGNDVTFVFETDDKNVESVSVSGNFQWYEKTDPAVAGYTSTLDYSKAVSYNAHQVKDGMINTGYGLN